MKCLLILSSSALKEGAAAYFLTNPNNVEQLVTTVEQIMGVEDFAEDESDLEPGLESEHVPGTLSRSKNRARTIGSGSCVNFGSHRCAAGLGQASPRRISGAR
jgi:hypothetical protein